jgi:uncharacterized protein involved in exopolysaccharide biosynthesis
VSEARDGVITELDRFPAAPSDNGSRNGDHGTAPPTLSPMAVLELLWAQRQFILRRVLAAILIFTVVAFMLPKHYAATTRLMPPGYGVNSEMALALPALSEHEGGGGGAGVMGGGGVMGLASQLLGMNTSGELFVGVIQSRTVEDRVINRLGLMNVYWDKYLEDARKHLESNTNVSIGSRTGIISISVTDKKPDRAAAIAKAYVTELNQVLAQVNTSSAHRERIFLEERMQEIKQRSEADSKEFALFASENAAVDIPSQAKAMVAAGAELQSQFIVAQSELKGLQQIYTASNARVRAAQARVDELRRQVDKFGGKDVDPAKDASLAHTELYPSVRQLPLLGVRYLDLFRRTKVDDAVFELLTKEYEIAKIQEAREVPTAQVLDSATVPEKKSSPHRLLMMLAGALSGFAFACGYLVGRVIWEDMDDGDPRKVLAQEVLSTVGAWTERTPFRRKLKAGFHRISIWPPRHDRRSA